MKILKEKNFEKELPAGYKQVKYINAKSAKFGIIFNVIAFAVLIVVMAVAIIVFCFNPNVSFDNVEIEITKIAVAYLILLSTLLVYLVLHELVHGAAYKMLTGEKLTFGISWSCAFCGVPNIYTYRKVAIISVLAPFVLFTALFIPILIVLYIFSSWYYLVAAFIFGLHLGGCSGDLYVFYLLSVKYKDSKTLMRDTGPEQYFFAIGNQSDSHI